jgi:DDE family transposase
MKENYSLQLSNEIMNQMQKDMSGVFYEMFPFEKLSEIKSPNERDRIYNTENTLLTMILTMTENDKSLQNAVNIYSILHSRNIKRIKAMDKRIKEEYNDKSKKRKRGRPRQSVGRIAKSKIEEISTDTSGFSQARKRLSLEAVNMVYKESRDFSGINYSGTWHGYRVFTGDGTYIQMQDTKSISEKYRVQRKNTYPKGLLEVIIEQGSGAVYDFILESDRKSELEILSRMISNLPKGSLLLADDLYNCFVIFALLREHGIEVIVPGKRVRKYKIIKKNAPGDEIVEIKNPKKSKWSKDIILKEDTLQMRRIEYENPNKEGVLHVLYTSLLNAGITKEEIILKYATRWDIEITIREIKTIMDISIVRSKSPDTAYKEVATALIAYNYIRKIIAKITENSDFSPEADIIQKFYEINTPVLVDKLGRKYSKWSPGRGGYAQERNDEAYNSEKAKPQLSKAYKNG